MKKQPNTADEQTIVAAELEKMAAFMAQGLPTLDCPECCGPVYQFIEIGARVYGEEMEWAYFSLLLHACRNARQAKGQSS